MSDSVCIITPTIGNIKLIDCHISVMNQTIETTHLMVADGGKFLAGQIEDMFWNEIFMKVDVSYVPYNTGGEGYYGHRIYGAFSLLVPHDYIIFLDEDNWIAPNHVESLVNLIKEKDLDWAYSLRSIYDKDGNYLCDDNGESLGKYQGAVGYQFVDTSCYCIKREVAAMAGAAWYQKWGGDRHYYNVLSQHFPKYDCTGEHTLCYRLDGNPNSPKKEFFEAVNTHTLAMYGGNLPWIKKS